MLISFTTNDKFWSKVARFLSGEQETHLGIIFDNQSFQLAFDCSTTGFRVQNKHRFYSINQEVKRIYIHTNESEDMLLMRILLHRCVGKKYDFKAYKWMLWRGILRKIFGIDKPIYNPRQEYDKFLCTEILEPIREQLALHGVNLSGYDLASMTPKEIFMVMRNQLCLSSNRQ